MTLSITLLSQLDIVGRSEVDERKENYDQTRDPIPTHTNIKCGWCHNPAEGRL
eukprot:SAG31_NODE_133_length_23315_cov_4.858847_14_plen_53_part_00